MKLKFDNQKLKAQIDDLVVENNKKINEKFK
jgi:hypothetical protein